MLARPSSVMLGLLLTLSTALLTLTVLTPELAKQTQSLRLNESARLVSWLGLTDLALMTESRYTRHPSQADIHTAFQDHPAALDHFPSGSLMAPPRHLTAPLISSEDPHVAGKTTSSD